MKILAIRGKNLASLADDFEVDFSCDPLASAGLFAISGPTGSGKSTLLDALCLALYGATPRLAGASRAQIPDVQSEQIAPSDVRTLLRRGKGEGYAEVDFVAIDDVAYRARWSIRRARLKADGRLQNVDYLLTRVADGQAVGGTLKSEVHGNIERLLGLNFAQFTRAVLLAQNDFATFLKADDDERAGLLQTLTGTERFERLSARVYARAALEKAQLDDLNRQLADSPPLSDEALAQLKAAHAEARAAAAVREKQIAALESAQRWRLEETRLVDAKDQAQTALERATQTRQAAAARRAHLERVDAVAPARPLQVECERLEREADQAATQARIQAGKRVEAEALKATADAALNQARLHRDAASLTQQQAQPEIEAAKRLDTEIDTLTPQCQSARRALEAAGKEVGKHETERAEMANRQALTAKALGETDQWLAQNALLETLANDWAHWEYLFKQAETAAAEADVARADLARLQQAENAARAAEAEQGKALDARVANRLQAEAAEQSANAQYARFDPDQIARQKAAAEAQRQRLADAQSQWAQWRERQREHDTVESEAAAARLALRETDTALTALRLQRPGLEGRVQQAERALQRTQAACNQDVDGLRAALVEGEACPVCGALEHPYAESRSLSDFGIVGFEATAAAHFSPNSCPMEQPCGSESGRKWPRWGRFSLSTTKVRQAPSATHRLHALLMDQRAEHEALRKALQELMREEAGRDATLRAQHKQLAGLETRLRDLAGRRDAALQSWRHSRQNSVLEKGESLTDVLANLAEDDIAAWFVDRRDADEAVLRKLIEQETGLRAARKVKDAAQTQLSAELQAEQQARESGLAARETLRQSAQAVLQAQQCIAQAMAMRDGVLEQLDAVLNRGDGENAWRAEWLRHPAAFREARQTAVSTWLARRKARENQARALDTLAGQIDKAGGLVEKAREIEAQARTLFDSQAQQIEEKRQARARLLGGKPVVAVESELVRSLADAQNRLAERERDAAQAATAAVQAATACDLAAATQIEIQAKSSLAVANRVTWLTEFNADAPALLDVAGLRQLLGVDAAWLAGERGALNGLDQTVAEEATVLKERQAQLAAHRAQAAAPVADVDTAELARQLVELRPLFEQEKAAVIEQEVALRQDDERRIRLAGLIDAMRAQADKTEIWARLNELIGSADGRKFRRIAQQYTLDVLLGYANLHLAELSRRYWLERPPDSLTLLVVDQDMGDERRSVHSLSGGESFLVSLALALGLASLSSHSVRVESLFIDEGFGSLDAETLAIAMDALDNLQTQGRKVGVISHVHEMAERIGVQIQVKPESGGRSRLSVVG